VRGDDVSADVTTQWARAGIGWWRRERGVLLIARTHLRGTDLAAAVGSIRAEVKRGATTVLRDCESEESARAWCERWAEILLREGDR
jgi:hypothetical protein